MKSLIDEIKLKLIFFLSYTMKGLLYFSGTEYLSVENWSDNIEANRSRLREFLYKWITVEFGGKYAKNLVEYTPEITLSDYKFLTKTSVKKIELYEVVETSNIFGTKFIDLKHLISFSYTEVPLKLTKTLDIKEIKGFNIEDLKHVDC